MSDDLNLLITFFSTSKEMVKVAIKIEHGLGKPEWNDVQYFREPEVEHLILNALPLHVQTFCERILTVEEIFYISEG